MDWDMTNLNKISRVCENISKCFKNGLCYKKMKNIWETQKIPKTF